MRLLEVAELLNCVSKILGAESFIACSTSLYRLVRVIRIKFNLETNLHLASPGLMKFTEVPL